MNLTNPWNEIQWHKQKPKMKLGVHTPPKINIEPENDALESEDDFPLWWDVLSGEPF